MFRFLFILLPFCLWGCADKSVGFNPEREFKTLKSLEQYTHWWHQEHKWFLNSLQQHPNHPAKAKLPAIENLVNKTDDMVQYIERVKADLIRYVGKSVDPYTKMPVYLKKKSEVWLFFQHFEIKFHSSYALYNHHLNVYLKGEKKKLIANKFDGKSGKDYYEETFGNIYLIEALQILTLLQIEVFRNAQIIWESTGFAHRDFVPES